MAMLLMPSWITAIIVLLAYFLYAFLRKGKTGKLPPGPRALPVIGHLHLLGKNPHHFFNNLSKKYGPILSMRFGFYSYIIVSSPQLAEQILKTHDLVFASRPFNEASKYVSWNQKNLTFSKYGSYWRDMRKLCTLELLSSVKINSLQAMREGQIGLFIESLKKASQDHLIVDLSSEVLAMIADISCLMIFGKKSMDKELDERGFKVIIQEGMKLAVTPNLGDYFPYLGVIDLQGLTRRLKALAKVWDRFFEKILDDHSKARGTGQGRDFVDTMMNIMESGEAGFHIDRGHIKAILLDMLAGSMDTTATSIDWVFSELLKHPQVMTKVQKELEKVVGMERMVQEQDLEKLEYLDMVIKESFRLHPIAPLLLPHESMEDCVIEGYHIPKGTRVIVNTWSIGRNPNVWADPEKFFPERFIGSNIDLRGRDFELLPFGSGRRGCPGMQLGLILVKLVVAQLAHCFQWELPNKAEPSGLDMEEEFGIVVCRANHLKVIPTYRLNIQ